MSEATNTLGRQGSGDVDDVAAGGVPTPGIATGDPQADAALLTEYLQFTARIADTSTAFLGRGLSKPWERAYDHFHSRHPSGSKYHSADYRLRSRLFRPKTRAMIRRSEAAAASAFFATADVVAVEPEDDSDEMERSSAQLMNAIVNYRLTRTIPWFLVSMGSFQTSRVLGVCCTKQWWEYQEEVWTEDAPQTDPATGAPMVDPLTGQPVMAPVERRRVLVDRPRVDPISPERLRFHPNSDWLDPVNSSPYVQEWTPAFVSDVKARMKRADTKTGAPEWIAAEDATILKARVTSDDAAAQGVERSRSGQEKSPEAQRSDNKIEDHDVVWVLTTISRIEGRDYIWWSLGKWHMLTMPKPLDEVMLHGIRPYVWGYGSIEAFNCFPSGSVTLVSPLQQEITEVTNQRMDNVRLAINGRYFVRHGKSVDLQSLRRSSPGSITMMSDIEKDVRWERAPDVTRSSYEEQDRLNNEFDDLGGVFSTASVQSNRQLSDTVGGMKLVSKNADSLTEYDLRVFAETWAEPVLWQLVQLERAYETDDVVLKLAAGKAKLLRPGEDLDYDRLFEAKLTARVSVGVGSTDPTTALQRFLTAATAIGQIFGPKAAEFADPEAVIAEVFGKAGYKDGKRFFTFGEQDPKLMVLQQQIQQLTQALEGKTAEIEAESRADQELERMRQDGEDRRLAAELEAGERRERIKASAQHANMIVKARAAGDGRPPAPPRGPR